MITAVMKNKNCWFLREFKVV